MRSLLDKTVYILSSRGISCISYMSVLRHLLTKFQIASLQEAHKLCRALDFIHFGEDWITYRKGQKISFNHGEIMELQEDVEVKADDYYMVAPNFYEEVMKCYMDNEKSIDIPPDLC